MRVVHHMAESLRAGDIVAVFPEGTTGDGEVLLPFHANLFQAAISADAPAQPVVRFLDRATGRNSEAPLYLGDDTLVASLWRTLAGRPFVAHVRFGRRRSRMAATGAGGRRTCAGRSRSCAAFERWGSAARSPQPTRGTRPWGVPRRRLRVRR